MLLSVQKISEKKMLRNWAIAEATSTRRWKDIQSLLSSITLEKLQNKNFDSFNKDDYKNLENMIKSFRDPLLNGLLPLKLSWYKGKLSVKDINNLKIMNWPDFVNFSGSRNLIDLVDRFEQGEFPKHLPEFIDNFERISNNLDLGKMIGLPILVSRSLKGPYYLVEGFTRVSAILLNIKKKTFINKYAPFIVGVGTNLGRWYFDNGQARFSLI